MFSSVIGCVLLACAVGVSSLSVDLQQKQQSRINQRNELVQYQDVSNRSAVISLTDGIPIANGYQNTSNKNYCFVPNFFYHTDFGQFNADAMSYESGADSGYFGYYCFDFDNTNDTFSITPRFYFTQFYFGVQNGLNVDYYNEFQAYDFINNSLVQEIGYPASLTRSTFFTTELSADFDNDIYTLIYPFDTNQRFVEQNISNNYDFDLLTPDLISDSSFIIIYYSINWASYYSIVWNCTKSVVSNLNGVSLSSYPYFFGVDFYSTGFYGDTANGGNAFILTDDGYVPDYDGARYASLLPSLYSTFYSGNYNLYNGNFSYYNVGSFTDDNYINSRYIYDGLLRDLNYFGFVNSYRSHTQIMLPSNQYYTNSCYSWTNFHIRTESGGNIIREFITFEFFNPYSDLLDSYNDGYYYGFGQGQEVGYENGYNDGFNTGNSDGYSNGYDNGYRNGLNENTNTTFLGLFGAVADTPILMLRSLFDFDLFGINILTAVLSLITGIFVVYLVRKFI